MDARDAICTFIGAAASVLDELSAQQQINPAHRALDDLIRAVRQGRCAAKGRIGSLDYSVHGIGSGFERAGAHVELDVAADGRPTFDAWRVQEFLASAGLPAVDSSEIDGAARKLVAEGFLVEIRSGWYSFVLG